MGGRERGAPHMYYYPLECLQLTELREEEEEKKEEKDDENKENIPTS
jgi:hypothetical protein